MGSPKFWNYYCELSLSYVAISYTLMLALIRNRDCKVAWKLDLPLRSYVLCKVFEIFFGSF